MRIAGVKPLLLGPSLYITIRLRHRHELIGRVFSGRYHAQLVEGSGPGAQVSASTRPWGKQPLPNQTKVVRNLKHNRPCKGFTPFLNEKRTMLILEECRGFFSSVFRAPKTPKFFPLW